MNGGEDYELLFTVPIADHEKVSQMEGIRLIGHITKPELGCALITRDGQEFELKAQGWNPLKRRINRIFRLTAKNIFNSYNTDNKQTNFLSVFFITGSLADSKKFHYLCNRNQDKVP